MAAPDTTAEPRAVMTVRAFLTMPPSSCLANPKPASDADRGVILRLQDTTGLLVGRFQAQWLGVAALEFTRQHEKELKPGRCLDLEIYHIKPAALDNELRARVKSCALAPLAPSWIKHEEKLNPSNPEKQTA